MNQTSIVVGILVGITNILVVFGGGFKVYVNIVKKLDRVEYALYNDGKTGLINKVDELIENQQLIKTEVEIIKVRIK
jgi:hypothetical protein